MIFRPILDIIRYKPINGWFILISLIIIFGMMCWVSYQDIRNQKITFWKLILTGFVSIFLPFVYSFMSGNGFNQILAYGLSIPMYIFLLSVNYNCNKDRFIGKADIDIISAQISLSLAATFWQIRSNSGILLKMNISYIWLNFLFYLTVGLALGAVVFLLWFGIEMIKGNKNIFLLMKDTRVPVLPSLIVVVVLNSYTLMIM